MLQPPDFGFLHFHRAQFNALVDRNAADVVDNSLARFQAMLAELIERGIGGGHGIVDAVEHAVPADETAATRWRRRRFDFREHLFDDGTN